MLIVLNKIDLIPEEERDQKIEKAKKKLSRALKSSKFADAPMIALSAAVGGEKVAAVRSSGTSSSSRGQASSQPVAVGLPALISLMCSQLSKPKRNKAAPFFYSIDHCFSIKGSVPSRSAHLIDPLDILMLCPPTLRCTQPPCTPYSHTTLLFHSSDPSLRSINPVVSNPVYLKPDTLTLPIALGHGTVLTGTVLSGSVSVNSHIEIPNLQLVRKVKSLQMFRLVLFHTLK